MALDAARMGTWNWDIETNKITWSKNLEDLFGVEKNSFKGTYAAFLNCIHPEDRNFVTCSVMQAIREDKEYDIEFRVVLPDGSIRWIASKGIVFRDAAGTALRMSGVDMDITKRKQAEAALEIHANQQAFVAQLSQSALAGCDLTTLMNSSVTFIAQCLKVEYCKLWELQSDNDTLLLRAVVGWDAKLVGQATISAGMNSQAGYTLFANEPVIVSDIRTEMRFHPSQFLPDQKIISSLSVVIHGKERPFGVLGVHTTTQRTFKTDEIYFLQAVANVLATAIDRQRVEDALKESEQRWQLSVRGTNDGIWDWNVKTNEVFFSTRWKKMLGYEEHEISNHLNEWLKRVHPDDINRVMQAVQDHFDRKTPFYISEHRVCCKDGSYKWILDRGQALWDKNDNVVRMAGSHTDITERKLAEEQLRQSEERFHILARATNDAVWDWNLLSNQTWWNQSVQTLFGYSPEEANSDSSWWSEHIHPEDRRRIVSDIRFIIDSGQQFWSNEYRFRRSDGSYAYILDRGYVVHDADGKPLRMIGAMMDMTDRKRVQQELQKQNMRSQLFADVTLKIRKSLQLDEILHTSVTEVQKLLNADRVLILRLRSDGSVLAVKEAVVPGLPTVFWGKIFSITALPKIILINTAKDELASLPMSKKLTFNLVM